MVPKFWLLLLFLTIIGKLANGTVKNSLKNNPNWNSTFSFRKDIVTPINNHFQSHQHNVLNTSSATTVKIIRKNKIGSINNNNDSNVETKSNTKRGEIDSSLSSAFSELQPVGPPQIVSTPEESAASKKFKISQKLYNKLSALKLNGKNEVITLPGVVNVYGPPPKALGMPQAQEPLNIVASPHLTKFHSYHKFSLLPVTFRGEVNPINLYTNRKPVEVNTGRPKHLFLPFSPRRRVNPFSRFYNKGLPVSNFIRKHSRYVHLLPHRRIFTTAFKQQIPEFRAQPYEEEAALARHALPSYAARASSQPSPELLEALKNANGRPRYIDGGPPVEKFMPGRELTLAPNEDVDLRHLNLRDGNFQTIPTDTSRGASAFPAAVADETANERSPGVELYTVNNNRPSSPPQDEFANHAAGRGGVEQIPNTIQSPVNSMTTTSASTFIDNRDAAGAGNIEAAPSLNHVQNEFPQSSHYPAPISTPDNVMGGEVAPLSGDQLVDNSRQGLDNFDSPPSPAEGVMGGLGAPIGGGLGVHHGLLHHYSKLYKDD